MSEIQGFQIVYIFVGLSETVHVEILRFVSRKYYNRMRGILDLNKRRGHFYLVDFAMETMRILFCGAQKLTKSIGNNVHALPTNLGCLLYRYSI